MMHLIDKLTIKLRNSIKFVTELTIMSVLPISFLLMPIYALEVEGQEYITIDYRSTTIVVANYYACMSNFQLSCTQSLNLSANLVHINITEP